MNLILKDTRDKPVDWFNNWLKQWDLRLLKSLSIEESETWYKGIVEGWTMLPGNGDPHFKIKVKIYKATYPGSIPHYDKGESRVQNKDEAYIWILGHEIYHFLRQTRQINGKQKEKDADEFGKKLLKEFRQNSQRDFAHSSRDVRF